MAGGRAIGQAGGRAVGRAYPKWRHTEVSAQ